MFYRDQSDTECRLRRKSDRRKKSPKAGKKAALLQIMQMEKGKGWPGIMRRLGGCLELVMGHSWGEEKTESKAIYRKGGD